MTKHETGPWQTDTDDISKWHILGPSNGFCANVIATVHSTDLDEGAANARLIAAAPDMADDAALVIAFLLDARAVLPPSYADRAASLATRMSYTAAKARGEA